MIRFTINVIDDIQDQKSTDTEARSRGHWLREFLEAEIPPVPPQEEGLSYRQIVVLDLFGRIADRARAIPRWEDDGGRVLSDLEAETA